MKVKKGIFKKCIIQQIFIVAVFVAIGFSLFRADEEFQVNTLTVGRQLRPAVAMDRKGNFVITWMSDEQDGSDYGIFAQKFNKKGNAIGPEFQVNTYTIFEQMFPAVAMDWKGNFVITWDCIYQDGSYYGIFAQRFDKKGNAIGPEFQVNTYTKDGQMFPAVAMDKKGNFVVTWQSYNQNDNWGIFAQRFDREGNAIGPEFQVNTFTKRIQVAPAVAMDKKGNFVVAWESKGQDGSGYGIFAQRFDKEGNAIGPEFQVNTFTESNQEHPAVAMDTEGNFAITWESNRQDGSGYGIFAQNFDKEGNGIGPEFQVNTDTIDRQIFPAVAMDTEGNFAITWESKGQDGSGYGIFAQRFDKEGNAIGPEFQVNTFTESNQEHPAIAMDTEGNFAITWESNRQDGSMTGVFAKLFRKQ